MENNEFNLTKWYRDQYLKESQQEQKDKIKNLISKKNEKIKPKRRIQ